MMFDITKSLKIPKGYHNPYIEEEQTTQWPKEKIQKVKQRSTKHTYKTKDRVTRIPTFTTICMSLTNKMVVIGHFCF
jgi:hypothetical protein